MSTSTTPDRTTPKPAGPKPAKLKRSKYKGIDHLSPVDRVVVSLMIGIPTLLVLWLVVVPAVGSVLLSFTNWDGIGPISSAKVVGLQNYKDVLTIYPPFVPALQHNLIWLAVMFFIATPIGMFLAILLDREVRGSRVYQTAIYLPVVLSLALVGFIWQLIYSRDQGFINQVTGGSIDWYGDTRYNLWAALLASSWRHVGYIMLLYLAGLKGVDPTLREAAKVDGANERTTFFKVVFPVMFPINIIVLVVTVIESLRAFDLVWVINKGRNGLELISTLVTSNIVGEASRIGFGSALATFMLVISSIFIVIYLRIVMREQR